MAALLLGAPASAFGAAQNTPSPTMIQSVSVVGKGQWPEVQINATGNVTISAQSVTGPDRIVLDFEGAVPAATLRNLAVHQGLLKSIRAGLFKSQPPVTRVVLDMEAPVPYHVFPSGNRTTIKLGAASAPEANAAAATAPATPPPPAKTLVVGVRSQLLSIRAAHVTLAEVLYEVHRRTGAEIGVPAGAEQEQVMVNLGPGPGKEVLSALLNGTRFNFIILGGERDPGGLHQVLLSNKSGESGMFARPSGAPPVAAVPQRAPDMTPAEPVEPLPEEVQTIPDEPEQPAPDPGAQQQTGAPQQPGVPQNPPEQPAPDQ